MPTLIVYGTPQETPEFLLESMINDLQFMVAGTEGTGTDPGKVFVFFPPDRIHKGLGEEIIVFITGLPTGISNEILQKVAGRVGLRIKYSYFKKARVEVLIQTIDPQLFWASKETTC
jgi:hypothetical protein